MTRIEFILSAALSPLALFGIRRKEPKDEPHPYPFYGTWKKCAEEWEKTARLRDKDADYWQGRALEAEFDLECMGVIPVDEEMIKQSRMDFDQGLSQTAKEIYDELQELRRETA